MEFFLELLKIVSLSTLGGAVLGAISGGIYSAIVAAPTHQPMPNWMRIGRLGAVLGFVIGLLFSVLIMSVL